MAAVIRPQYICFRSEVLRLSKLRFVDRGMSCIVDIDGQTLLMRVRG